MCACVVYACVVYACVCVCLCVGILKSRVEKIKSKGGKLHFHPNLQKGRKQNKTRYSRGVVFKTQVWAVICDGKNKFSRELTGCYSYRKHNQLLPQVRQHLPFRCLGLLLLPRSFLPGQGLSLPAHLCPPSRLTQSAGTARSEDKSQT